MGEKDNDMLSSENAEAELLAKISSEYLRLRGVQQDRQKLEATLGVLPGIQDFGISGSTENVERIILVSRRLPYQLRLTETGVWRAEMTAMNQALQNLRAVHERYGGLWVGLPGVQVDPGHQMAMRDQLRDHRLIPIFIDPVRNDQFYAGYCRTILWPLLHYSLPTTEDMIASNEVYSREDERGEQDMWQAYKAVNQHFADSIQDIYRDGDMIWVHDYHLMLVPQMLRALIPSAKIGFFLHVPFPSSEIYRILPNREHILEGLLGSDLLGFQTYDYARHFLSTVESILDADCSRQGVEYNGHFASAAICPVGIDPEAWVALARCREVEILRLRWAKQLQGRKVMLGVDGLDATKGLVHKFLAIEEMFDKKPELAEEVSFVQVCTGGASSGRGSGDRQVLAAQIHGFVGRINSKLASIDEEGPIKFFLDVNLQELCALYCIADVLVITPIRDGMNISPFEYVVSREAHNALATVVLSEFAGCARSLGGALLVNPWSTNEVAEAIEQAIFMDKYEREKRHENMSSYVWNFTSQGWSTRSMRQLIKGNEGGERSTARELHKEHVVQAFAFSRCRLIVLNFEGVLAPPTSLPELLTIPDNLLESLRRLSTDPLNVVVVKSPRSRETLERCLGSTNCVLAAEHGALMRWGSKAKWESQLPGLDTSWLSEIQNPLEYYTERTPGSVIERRDASVAWHYRDCDIGHGAWQAKQLHVSLIQMARTLPIVVYAGDKVLEILPQAMLRHLDSFLDNVVTRVRQDLPQTLSNRISASPSRADSDSDKESWKIGEDYDVSYNPSGGSDQYSGEGNLDSLSIQHLSISSSAHRERQIFGTGVQSDISDLRDADSMYSLMKSESKSSSNWSTASFASTPKELQQAVDLGYCDLEFVLVIAGGQGVNDESMFASMVPVDYIQDDNRSDREPFDGLAGSDVDFNSNRTEIDLLHMPKTRVSTALKKLNTKFLRPSKLVHRNSVRRSITASSALSPVKMSTFQPRLTMAATGMRGSIDRQTITSMAAPVASRKMKAARDMPEFKIKSQLHASSPPKPKSRSLSMDNSIDMKMDNYSDSGSSYLSAQSLPEQTAGFRPDRDDTSHRPFMNSARVESFSRKDREISRTRDLSGQSATPQVATITSPIGAEGVGVGTALTNPKFTVPNLGLASIGAGSIAAAFSRVSDGSSSVSSGPPPEMVLRRGFSQGSPPVTSKLSPGGCSQPTTLTRRVWGAFTGSIKGFGQQKQLNSVSALVAPKRQSDSMLHALEMKFVLSKLTPLPCDEDDSLAGPTLPLRDSPLSTEKVLRRPSVNSGAFNTLGPRKLSNKEPLGPPKSIFPEQTFHFRTLSDPLNERVPISQLSESMRGRQLSVPQSAPMQILQTTSTSTHMEASKEEYTPRRHFPPATLLFQAMRAKYGDSYRKQSPPDTAEGCWALVNSMSKSKETIHLAAEAREKEFSLEYNKMGTGTFGNSHWTNNQYLPQFEIPLATETDTIAQSATENQKTPMDAHKKPLLGFQIEAKKAATLKTITPSNPPSIVAPIPPYLASKVIPEPKLGPNRLKTTPEKSHKKMMLPFLEPSFSETSYSATAVPSGGVQRTEMNLEAQELRGLDLPINTFSCTVGLKISQAQYYIKSHKLVGSLLKDLSELVIDTDTGPKTNRSYDEVELFHRVSAALPSQQDSIREATDDFAQLI